MGLLVREDRTAIVSSVRRAGKGVRLVIGNGAAKAIDDGLASLIARAIATRNMFLAGRDDSIDAMASRLGVRRDYVAVLVRLSYLSPEIVRAILVGQRPVELTPTRLVMLSRNLPHDWQGQRRLRCRRCVRRGTNARKYWAALRQTCRWASRKLAAPSKIN